MGFDRAGWTHFFKGSSACMPEIQRLDQCGLCMADFTVVLAVFEGIVQLAWIYGTGAITESKSGYILYLTMNQHWIVMTDWVNTPAGHRNFGDMVCGAGVVIYAKGEYITLAVNKAG